MATSSTRQRKLARAKLDRQMAKRAERERKQRQLKAVAAGVVTLLVATLGGLWIGGVFDKEPVSPPVASDCTWNAQNVEANQAFKNVGVPKTTGILSSGQSTMTVQFNSGTVAIDLDRTLAKCGAEALAFVAGQGYYTDTKCHEIKDGALTCGDASGSGVGGAAFTWVAENVPAQAPVSSAEPTPSGAPSGSPTATATASAAPSNYVRYPAGTVAMRPGVSGSQFLIFYQDSTSTDDYSIVGTVRPGGLDVIKKIADAGTVDNGKGANTKPKNDVIIQSLTVVDPAAQASADPSANPSTDPSTQPTASTAPTASATPGS